MTDPGMSPEETEDGMSNLFRSLQVGPDARGLDEGFFEKVRSLLSSAGKLEWSKRPRSYTVLRMINRLDALDRMVMEGCLDLHFPFSDLSVPEPLKASSVRFKFLEAQKLVVTKATSMETETGQHAHFHSDANVHFHILNPLLGRGAFGVVDHVRSKLSLNEFARKRISRARTFAKDKAAIKVFENELRNLRRLKHIHLVEVVGSYTDPKFIGLLMSPIAETTLKIFLDAHQCPNHTGDLPLLRQFVGCLAGAVSYLHTQKCRHKDIKPSNILIKGDHVLLTDFGTARDWSDRTHGTTTGPTGPYTPGYASPEVVDQTPRGEPSDIWSLGCVYLDILTVLTGDTFAERIAFFESHGTGLALVRSNLEAFPSYMDHLAVKSSGDRHLQMWIGRMLQASPAQRITASALFEQIQDQADEHQYYGECCFDSGYSTDGSDAASAFMDDTIVLPPGITRYDQSKDAANHRPPNADAPRETRGERDEQEEKLPQNFTTSDSSKDIHDKESSESRSEDSGLPESEVSDDDITHNKEVFIEILESKERMLRVSAQEGYRYIPSNEANGEKSFEEFPTSEERGPRSHEVWGNVANKAQPDSICPPADKDGVPPSRWYEIANPKQVVARRHFKGAVGKLRQQIALLLDSEFWAFRNNLTEFMCLLLSASDACLCNGQDEDAEMSATLAVSNDPTNALPWLFVAEARMGLKNRAGALEAYQRAIELSSSDATAKIINDLSQARLSFLKSRRKGRGIYTPDDYVDERYSASEQEDPTTESNPEDKNRVESPSRVVGTTPRPQGAVIGEEDYQAILDELANPWESSEDEPLEPPQPQGAVIGEEDYQALLDELANPWESSEDEPLEPPQPLPAVRRVNFDPTTRPGDSSSERYERRIPSKGSYQGYRLRKDITIKSPRPTIDYDDNCSTAANVGYDKVIDEAQYPIIHHQDRNPRKATYYPSQRQRWQPLPTASRAPPRFVDESYAHAFTPYPYNPYAYTDAPAFSAPQYYEQAPIYTSQLDTTTEYLASNPADSQRYNYDPPSILTQEVDPYPTSFPSNERLWPRRKRVDDETVQNTRMNRGRPL